MTTGSISPLIPPPRQRLYRRVMGAVSVIFLVMTLFVAIGVINFVYQADQAAWHVRQHEAAKSAALTVDTFIVQVQNYIKLIGSLDRDYLEKNPGVINQLLQDNPALLEVVRLDHEGSVLAGASHDAAPLLQNTFTLLQAAWFNEARAGQSYISRVEISATNEPYIILALPAPDGGVVAARLRMNILWDVVSASRFGQTGQVYILNNNGDLVAHPQIEQVLAHTTLGGRPEVTAMLAAPNNEWQGTYLNFEGKRVSGATHAVSDGYWVIVAEVSQAETLALSYRAAFILGGGVLLIGGLVILLTNLVLRQLVLQPIEALRDGAAHIGQGNLDYRIKSQRPDELGQLAEAFNEMSANLQDREKRLAEARDQALAANRLKSQLLANVSHDLRTPLNAILGHTEMLQRGIYGPLSDGQSSIMLRVMNNVRNLTGMVQKLLGQAQLEAQTLKIEMSPFAPSALIQAVEMATAELAHQKGLNLECQVSPDLPPTLLGDYNWLYQILVNLTENALKFTEQGSVQVSFYRHDESCWAMQVTDTGPGIPTEAHSYIFEAFRQVDGTVTRTSKGVGLGLSIVKQVTELMNGQIILDSKPGQGSTFTILLPLISTMETIDDKSARFDYRR